MRKLIVFLMVLSLIFMSVAPSAFAVFSEVNIGPTTDFDGDINIPAGKAYYINEVLLDLEDIGTAGLIKEAMFDADAPANLDILIYSTGGTDFLWKTPSELITAGTLIAWDGTTLDVTIPAEHIDSDMYIDGSIDHEHLAVDVITGWAADTLAAADTFLFHDNDGADLNKITWDNLMATISKIGTVTSGTLSTGAVLADVTMTLGSDADYDLYYRASNKLTRLAPNTVASNKFLRMIGTGAAGQAPTWAALEAGDIPDISGTYQPLDTGLTNLAALAYAEASMIKMTDTDTYATRTMSEVRTDLGLVIGTDVAACGANTDITSLYNASLMVGRDISNDLDWSVDNHLTWTINDDAVDLVGFATGIAGNDELPTKGYVDELLGASQIAHYMDVDAADVDYIIAVSMDTDKDWISDLVLMPDYGRNITVTGGASADGTVTITGTLADGTTGQTEDIVVVADGTAAGSKAFTYISAIVLAGRTAGSCTVGIGDKIGLPSAIDGATDVYYKTVDGIAVFSEISGKVDTTNYTLDCSAIAQNEDITIYYHN